LGFGLLTCPEQRNAAPVVAARQTRTYAEAKASPTEVSSILEQRIRGVQEEAGLAETGRVLSVGYVFQCWESERSWRWSSPPSPAPSQEISDSETAGPHHTAGNRLRTENLG